MVEAVDKDLLGGKLGVGLLDHIHDFLLDEIKVLCIAGRCSAYHIVDLDVVVLS